MIEHLSYSSISTFLTCAENWRRKYITKEPTYSTPALVFGKAIHQTIEQWVGAEGPCDPAKLLTHWQSAWSAAIEGETVVWGLDQPAEHYNEGVRILSNEQVIYNLTTIQPRRNDEGQPAIERKVELRVPGVPVPIIGYIDIITQDGVPGDFKTSARSWTTEKAAGELQPLFYLAALNQAGETVPGWRFRHYTIIKTKTPKFETFEVAHKPGEVFFLFEVISKVWRAIQNGVFPLQPNAWLCSAQYCDFYANCRGRYG